MAKKIKIKVKEENIWLQLDVNQIGESEIIIEKIQIIRIHVFTL